MKTTILNHENSLFYFCDNEYDANDCANLVIKKIKQATAASLWWYEKNNEKLPEIGDIYIITDWIGKAKAKIERVPYHEITPEFAKIEGEGDKSLEYWKDVHWNYYSREMKPHNDKPTIDKLYVNILKQYGWKNKVANIL